MIGHFFFLFSVVNSITAINIHLNLLQKHNYPDVHKREFSLTYYGGPVIKNMDITMLTWGQTAFVNELKSFYTALVKSSLYSLLHQYDIGLGTFNLVIDITMFAPNKTTIDDNDDIKPFLISLVQKGIIIPTANSYFPIHFGPSQSIGRLGLWSCQQFCAYHSTLDISFLNITGVPYLYYGIIPDLSRGACNYGCGSNSILNNLYAVSSHEAIETATDPGIGLATWFGPPLGWYGPNGEIGDICNAQQDTITVDGETYIVQKQWSNLDNACVVKSLVTNTTTTPRTTVSTITTVPTLIIASSTTTASSTKTITTTTILSSIITSISTKSVNPNIKCAHSICKIGIALNSQCDPCVSKIIIKETACGKIRWSASCVSKVKTVCKLKC